jgi:predicted transcriptional regulator
MATTSLKLPDELKLRVNALAAQAKKSPHAYMVDLIVEETARAEKRQAFIQSALEAKKDFDETRMAYDGDEVMHYYRAKIQGIELPKPALKKYK